MNVNGLSNDFNVYVAPQVRQTSPVEVKTEAAGNTNVGNEAKKQYLELAVGVKEKELKRLGLTEEEDGVVTMKKDTAKMTAWERIKEEEKQEKLKEEQEDGSEECETCAKRKYVDGSDEMVSFKSAAHIAPEAAASRVRAHEQEHVTNAYEKAATNNGKVQNVSVAIHTSVCPECGRTYVSGGTTTTTIRYNNDDYAATAKKQDATVIPGNKVDETM